MKRRGLNFIEILVAFGLTAAFLIPLYFFMISRYAETEIGEREFDSLTTLWEMKEQILLLRPNHSLPGKWNFSVGQDRGTIGKIPWFFSKTGASQRRTLEITRDVVGQLWAEFKVFPIGAGGRPIPPIEDRLLLGRI